jgi:UDP-N-acetylmuramoyl-L-alanyl-D-glutamate--2,6-diaminopimelate ligase
MEVSPKPVAPLLKQWGLTADWENEAASAFTGVSYDSRSVAPGHIFFCIHGEKLDGNNFISDAVGSGAVLIVSEKPKPSGFSQPYLMVKDVRRAMSEAADYLYDHPSQKLRVLGVTGTNGKTSTTHIIEHILNESGRKAGLVGTMGVRWAGAGHGDGYIEAKHTTPQAADLHRLFYQMVTGGVSHVAMEVSSHALALKRVDNCQFASACLTNITQDHLDFHKTMEHYWRSKLLLFSSLNTSPLNPKNAIVNIDQELAPEFLAAVSSSVNKYTYGFSEKADFRAKNARFDKSGTSLTVITPSGPLDLQLKLVGNFNVYNVLAALTICSTEGISNNELKEALESFAGVCGRFQVVSDMTNKEPKEPLCIVDYAHSPDGLENVLNVARELVPADGKLIVVFGCGGDRDTSKRPQMGGIAENLADQVVVTSDNPRSEDPQQIIIDILAGIKRMNEDILVEPDRAKAIQMAVLDATDNDIVVVAGKGHETYQIIKGQTFDFDDRIEVQKALRKREDSLST